MGRQVGPQDGSVSPGENLGLHPESSGKPPADFRWRVTHSSDMHFEKSAWRG